MCSLNFFKKNPDLVDLKEFKRKIVKIHKFVFCKFKNGIEKYKSWRYLKQTIKFATSIILIGK